MSSNSRCGVGDDSCVRCAAVITRPDAGCTHAAGIATYLQAAKGVRRSTGGASNELSSQQILQAYHQQLPKPAGKHTAAVQLWYDACCSPRQVLLAGTPGLCVP